MSLLKPRTATIPIYQGDDAETLSMLHMKVQIAERNAEEARQSGSASRHGDDPLAEVAKAKAEYNDFLDDAAERAVMVRIESIGKRRFRNLLAAHPARKVKNAKGEDVDHDDDFEYGVHSETFPLALLTFAEAGTEGVRTIVEPEFKSSKALQDFLDDEVTDGDFERLWQNAYWLNRAPGSDPKALRYSLSTNETSE